MKIMISLITSFLLFFIAHHILTTSSLFNSHHIQTIAKGKKKNKILRQHAKLVKHNNYVENETSGQDRFSLKIRGINIPSCFKIYLAKGATTRKMRHFSVLWNRFHLHVINKIFRMILLNIFQSKDTLQKKSTQGKWK